MPEPHHSDTLAPVRPVPSSACLCAVFRRTVLRVEQLEDRTVPTLLGQQLFPADNPWNQPIANAPVAASSAAIMGNLLNLEGNDDIHPDFSQDFHDGRDLYGIPYNVVHGNSTPKLSVVLEDYADESDPVPAPIPPNAVLEGDFQNGPNVGRDNRGDSHLIVWDVDNNIDYEFGGVSRPSENADGQWHATQESVWDMKANTFRTLDSTSADAAGLPILPGLVRPDEALPVSEGGQGVINHAIRVTLPNGIILNQFLYPASHIADDNNDPSIEPPMGARLRLKADVDLSQLSPESRIIAQAMKDYGLIVADNGPPFFFSGASDAVNANNQTTLTWNDDDIQDADVGLKSIPFSDFEVVDLTPVVRTARVPNGAAGTAVTVVGQNFLGAAGQLQVLFGSTPATSVKVLDDSHVVAVAPPGSGTVFVRVQSGADVAADPENVNGALFGYGISAPSVRARFTYGPAPADPLRFVATVGVVDPFSNWYLRNQNAAGTPSAGPFAYGMPGWSPLAGDWNGDGVTTIGAFDPATATWYLHDANVPGAPEISPFVYGAPGWIPVVGDWDGDGVTTIGMFDPATATWYLKNGNRAGGVDIAPFQYGAPGWIPVVGDWTGQGKTTIGVVDPGTGVWYLRNSNGPGAPDVAPFAYGAPGWIPVVGDWTGQGKTTVGTFDPATATWYLRNSNSPGAPDLAPFLYGGPGWTPVVGVWTFPSLPEPAARVESAASSSSDPETAVLSRLRANLPWTSARCRFGKPREVAWGTR